MTVTRRISEHDTVLDWLFLPGICLVLSIASIVVIALLTTSPGSWESLRRRGLTMLIAATATSTLLLLANFRTEIRLKRVALTDTALVISNYRRQITVPLGDIESVDQAKAGFAPIVVTFARDTAFGRDVAFKPIGFRLRKPHPIIEELRVAIAAAKRG